jgi:hypothetical protein
LLAHGKATALSAHYKHNAATAQAEKSSEALITLFRKKVSIIQRGVDGPDGLPRRPAATIEA